MSKPPHSDSCGKTSKAATGVQARRDTSKATVVYWKKKKHSDIHPAGLGEGLKQEGSKMSQTAIDNGVTPKTLEETQLSAR